MVLTNGKNDNLDPVALELAIDENGNIDSKKLGNNIAKLRKTLPGNKRAEMSQEELANAIIVKGKKEKEERAISVRTINSWECGKKLPSLKHLLKLCKVLNCDIDRLLGKRDYSTKELELICEYTGLTEKAVNSFCPGSPITRLVSYYCETYPNEFEFVLDRIGDYIYTYRKNEAIQLNAEKAKFEKRIKQIVASNADEHQKTDLIQVETQKVAEITKPKVDSEAKVAFAQFKLLELLSNLAKEAQAPDMYQWQNDNFAFTKGNKKK